MDLKNQKFYLNTNIWIYLFEGYEKYFVQLKELANYIQKNKITVYTSKLTIAEALVKPFLFV